MCGIAGIFSPNRSMDENHIYSMINSITHRGPDNTGIWINNCKSVYLGHTRLSIIDLSSNGNQPYHSKDGRYHITFNGEIYNFRDLKSFLKRNGIKNFLSNSDTEVLVELISFRGIIKATEMLDGMFAFAVWDSKNKIMHLARDRFGEKPLFYCLQGSTLFFGSEIKSLLKIPSIKRDINQSALSQYLRFNYIKNPITIYENIFKLEPGHILSIDERTDQKKINFNSISKEKELISDLKYAEELIENQLVKSCLSRTVSDVPIGLFLSGGLDSSLITSIIQNHSSKKIKTYTIGFDEKEIDESSYAENIANFLGTDHQNIKISNQELIKNIPLISKIYDEPFADQSSISTNILCNYASLNTKVILSGDGGDELFLGYDRYYKVKKLQNFINLSNNFQQAHLIKLFLKNLYKNLNRPNQFTYKIDKYLKLIELLIDTNNNNYLYQKFNSLYRDEIYPDLPLKYKAKFNYDDLNDIDSINNFDIKSYLPDCILTKVDRASMFNSLEVRSPFLDHKIHQIIQNLSSDCRNKLLYRKLILKKIIYKYLPKELVNRPKQGFSSPLKQWIDNPLKEWALDQLSISSLKKHDLFDESIIERIKKEHFGGIRSWHNQIWNLALFQQWYTTLH